MPNDVVLALKKKKKRKAYALPTRPLTLISPFPFPSAFSGHSPTKATIATKFQISETTKPPTAIHSSRDHHRVLLLAEPASSSPSLPSPPLHSPPTAIHRSRDHHRVLLLTEPASSSPNVAELAEPASSFTGYFDCCFIIFMIV
ncbi:hypothetical protein HN873_012639, partial [Arachis hypogaea]